MRDNQDFDNLMIKLASPETIRSWSYGEVKKPEIFNYRTRTLRLEKDGLFCERIFGTTKEWECYCGKYRSIRYKGIICDRCGVEVTHFNVRRERMGHIELAVPVSHIWYYRSVPSRMGLLLDLPMSALRSVLYYEKYIVIDPGDTGLRRKQLLTEDEFQEAKEQYGSAFTAGMGAEAIKTLLENIDLDSLADELRAKMIEKGPKSDKHLLRRLEIVESFRASTNKPSWMILEAIPVIPPELRPMVQLDGGCFAISNLNDLYQRVINRNNRTKRLMSLNAPDIIIRNEKCMLQEAVDALFDNSMRKRGAVKDAFNRPIKSISDLLKGKEGRFRQNLLGKRVDYSGSSVIVPGPELKMWQCGLPAKMALELFKPFVMKKLVDKDVVFNIKKAKLLVEQMNPEVFQALDEVVREHPVILHRAPTLNRLGIQAFVPVIVEGKAIKLSPLVCKAFNAGFDGDLDSDQMAVHVPLTQAAQMECWTLMLSSRNLLDPASGKLIVYPSQDMVLGLYYLTKERPSGKGAGHRYSGVDEVMMAAEAGAVGWQSPIKVKYRGEVIETTPGRLAFNEEMPEGVPLVNECLDDKAIRKLIERVYKEKGPWLTVQMLDQLKATGFKYATFFGVTLGMDDILVPEEKVEMIAEADEAIRKIHVQYDTGIHDDMACYRQACDECSKITKDLADAMMKHLKEDKDGFNALYMMAASGALESRKQIDQLAADAGKFTRLLIEIAHEVVVTEEDCGTINGIECRALKNGDEIAERLSARIAGNFTLESVRHPITNEEIIGVNEHITDEMAQKIEKAGVESLRLRSVLTCESAHGVCVKCYGRNLARNKAVEIGEAVGIIAAQSIGNTWTQLTTGLPRVSELFEARRPKYPAILSQISGTVSFKGFFKNKRVVVVTDQYGKEFKHLVPMGRPLLVRNGDVIEACDGLCYGFLDPHDILAILGERALQDYLIEEIQSVYRAQGVAIDDKHFGIIIRQMLRKVEIVSVGDTRFVYGQQVDKHKFNTENEKVIKDGGQPAMARPMFQGITKAALNAESFISAASFQETTKALINAAISGSRDELRGIKENIVIGHLVPAGTGIKHYRNVKLYDQDNIDLDEQMNEVLERRRLEKEAEVFYDDIEDLD